jgi:hypothetical protein
MKNKKGFTGIETIIAIAIIGAIVGFFGPSIVKSTGTLFNGGDKNQTKQTLKLSESYPIGHLDVKGNFIKMGDYKKTEDRLNLVAVQPPETLWQKFLHLGIMIIPIIALISYLGAWPLIKRYVDKIKNAIAEKEAKYNDLVAESRKIVSSVQAARAIIKENTDSTLIKKVDAAMDSVQDSSTKLLVGQLKNGGIA